MKNKILFSLFLLVILAGIVQALPAPANLSARAETQRNSVALSWNPVINATGYNIYRKEVTDLDYKRLNVTPVATAAYEDKSAESRKDYLYVVKSVSRDGRESAPSVSVGAPLMAIKTTASVTTLRDKPLSAKSVRTGKTVTFAAPGDIITYRISYANLGFSSASNVRIDYDIPDGTIIAGAPVIKKGPAAQVSYYDKIKKQWLSALGNEENVSKLRLNLAESVAPVRNNDVNGIIDLNVVITL
jgi:uncharacterized repeat protein (TIGR01451 family)